MADAVARSGGSNNGPGIASRLVAFYHGVMAEMRKVTWPDLPQVRSATISIIIFVLVLMMIVIRRGRIFRVRRARCHHLLRRGRASFPGPFFQVPEHGR